MEKPRILLTVKKNWQYYVDAINGAGGVAIAKYLPEIDTNYDGLILCGGNDMDPSYYGEDINGSVDIDYARDRNEMALLKAFLDAGKPVLGICRGCQLINVYFGGSLYQHLDNARAHTTGKDFSLIHVVKAAEGSITEKLYGREYVVNSYHHQAVKELGKGLKVTEWSADHQVIEGIEHTALPVFAVQWHPEHMCFAERRENTVDGRAVFDHFLQLCEKRREDKE